MEDEEFEVPYANKKIACVGSRPKRGKATYGVILTHGAGGDMHHKHMVELASDLVSMGNAAVFRFTCRGLNIVHRIKVYSTVLKYVLQNYDLKGVFLGGRSMGARAAVGTATSDDKSVQKLEKKILGIVCLAYPLHPEKQTSKLRDGPLLALKKPAFFMSGTNDAMCSRELLEETLEKATFEPAFAWLDGCDHGFKRKGGSSDDEVSAGFSEIVSWCEAVAKDAV